MSGGGFSSWWLRAGEGSARKITPAGLLLGRSAHCDVVLPSERASRRQALVYLASEGPRLEVLGQGETRVGERVVERSADLADGDVIGFESLSLTVSREESAAPRVRARQPVWVLKDPDGGLFGMASSPFLVGGSVEDDLRVAGWPDAALCFRLAEGGALEVEAQADATVDDTPLPAGQRARPRRGARITLDGRTLEVVTGGAFASGSTAASGDAPGLEKVSLEFLPRGGRLTLVQGGEAQTVYLSDRRCDLVAVLLSPPEPQKAGDPIEDDVVIARVWGKQHADRTNLNVLLHRVRKDLSRVGLDGHALLERTEGGGATRVAVHDRTEVELE